MNEPGKTEYYLAQIAHAIIASNAKDPKTVKLDNYLMTFKKARKAAPVPVGDKVSQSKQSWLGIVGAKINKQ